MHVTAHTFNRRCLCILLCGWLPLATLAGPTLDINLASEADLDSLKGVGPATTQRILAERSSAPFADWADLIGRVRGMRASSARKLSEQGLTVNGQPYPDTPRGSLNTNPP